MQEFLKSAAGDATAALSHAQIGDAKMPLSESSLENAGSKTKRDEAGVGRDQILQTAARLRLVLGSGAHAVAVTGIEAEDGVSMLAAQLAVAMAETGDETVLLVDGNAAAPRVHEMFQVSKSPGLRDVLENRTDLETAVQSRQPGNLFVLPIGESDHTLASLLASDSSAQIFKQMRERFRYVLFDAGLIRKSPDGMLLASRSDGVVGALAAGRRRQEEVVSFQEELKRLNLNLLGVVLTKTTARKA